jgi:hypothetical protein
LLRGHPGHPTSAGRRSPPAGIVPC